MKCSFWCEFLHCLWISFYCKWLHCIRSSVLLVIYCTPCVESSQNESYTCTNLKMLSYTYNWKQQILNFIKLNLHSHDLRVPVGSLSRFKLCLPQCYCNVPGVLNCMSGRLSGFPSLYWRYLCISYENYKYWQNAKVNPSSNTQQKVSGMFMLPPS